MSKAWRYAVIIFVAMLAATSWGQHAPSTQTLSTPLAATPATNLNITGTVTMFQNRARVFGDSISGSDTRYFAVTDADLLDKTPAQIQASLSPSAVTTQQHVRNFDIVVDLSHPLFIPTTSNTPVNIGTVTVKGQVNNNLVVTSDIIASNITIVKK